MNYQPIKRGMTEAITRGELEAAKREGREPRANVRQLAWFDTKAGMPCIFGVIDGIVHSWYETGRYSVHVESLKDLFALPRYEWQWLTINPDGAYVSVTVYHKTAEDAIAAEGLSKKWRVERIEGSKRLVKG